MHEELISTLKSFKGKYLGDGMGRSVMTDQIIAALSAPIDMVLHCPKCGKQHIDAPEGPLVVDGRAVTPTLWHNPPHRTHLCHGCGHKWRPADVPTNGVAKVKTRGKADSPVMAEEAVALMGGDWLLMDEEHKKHLRALDVALNGEAGAAAAPSLIDILWQVQDEAKKRGRPVLGRDNTLTHLTHCNFREHVGSCKYGDEACPALSDDYSWMGQLMQVGVEKREGHDSMRKDLSDRTLRIMWRFAGGNFHGPHTETGTMPEAQLLPFLRSILEETK